MYKLLIFTLLLGSALPAQNGDSYAPDWVSIEKNIPYGPHAETVLDILQPKTAPAGRRPGVIAIHGGGWRGGVKEREFDRLCKWYLENGFVVANVEYRLTKVASAPAAVEDVLAAANWFRSHAQKYNVDPNRIVVTGGSAGGHLALMVGMTPRSAKLGPPARVAAVVNFYGITDVGDLMEGPNLKEYAAAWVPEQEGRRMLARRVSPINYVRKDVPPILTIHGDADETVPYDHGFSLTKALRDAGAPAEMISIRGGGHGFPPEKMAELYQQIGEFLKRHKIY